MMSQLNESNSCFVAWLCEDKHYHAIDIIILHYPHFVLFPIMRRNQIVLLNLHLAGFRIKNLMPACHYKNFQLTDTKKHAFSLMLKAVLQTLFKKIPFEQQNLTVLIFWTYLI